VASRAVVLSEDLNSCLAVLGNSYSDSIEVVASKSS
jgi:hypothetical protein